MSLTWGGPDAQNPDQDYSVEYAYFWQAGQGRFKRVDGPGLPVNGVQYTYVADSDLLDTLDFMSGSSTTAARADYTHETNRNLVTAVEDVVDPNGTPTTVSKYDYGQGNGCEVCSRTEKTCGVDHRDPTHPGRMDGPPCHVVHLRQSAKSVDEPCRSAGCPILCRSKGWGLDDAQRDGPTSPECALAEKRPRRRSSCPHPS